MGPGLQEGRAQPRWCGSDRPCGGRSLALRPAALGSHPHFQNEGRGGARGVLLTPTEHVPVPMAVHLPASSLPTCEARWPHALSPH